MTATAGGLGRHRSTAWPGLAQSHRGLHMGDFPQNKCGLNKTSFGLNTKMQDSRSMCQNNLLMFPTDRAFGATHQEKTKKKKGRGCE